MQKLRKPVQEEAEVVAGGEYGVDAVALAAFEIAAVRAVLSLDVTDHSFSRGVAIHLAPDRGRDEADVPLILTRNLCGRGETGDGGCQRACFGGLVPD